MKWALAACLSVMACGEPSGPSEERAPEGEPGSLNNEPITVELLGRTVRVRCEAACPPLTRELDALRLSCMRDPTGVPHAVAMDGESLRGFGCCHEADRAYVTACGDELSRCTTGWLAECERGALSDHASGHGGHGAPPPSESPSGVEAGE